VTQSAEDTALAARIGMYAKLPADAERPSDINDVIESLLSKLEAGTIRSANKNAQGRWEAESWVKQGILLAFRYGVMEKLSHAESDFSFIDKNTIPPRRFDVSHGVRIVPGGSTIRRGTYVAKGVICMPPMFINVGAYVGEGTMVDSHALVGSCAQVGARVHISAAAQIGGVLEPINASPVVIEDDVVVGGNCGVYEGTVVRTKAVLAAGVVLTRGTPVYDLVNQTVHKGSIGAPLEIPENAVVVPGARHVKTAWTADHGVSIQTPVIVKYRDGKTDLATTLEDLLR
jgi:2,3,4,5-tetrahydropyridine-2-carboxylate N-succinyltransferase